jgi:hypothetical protein
MLWSNAKFYKIDNRIKAATLYSLLLKACPNTFLQAIALKADVSKAGDNEKMVAMAEKEFGMLTLSALAIQRPCLC